jgi:7,8-dihydro-6-hydroxymethylpterin-pyrophosphokinase
MMKTLYARREATTDATWIKYGPSRPLKRDLVIYDDETLTQERARIPWHHAASRARSFVMLNCSRYSIAFPVLPPAKFAGPLF